MLSSTLPLIWKCASADSEKIADVLVGQAEKVERLLLDHGAILFKGYEIDSVDKFQSCTDILPKGMANYVDGNSPRTKLTANVYTSTEYPPELPISLHNELSYSHSWPAKLYFCCTVAPETGGSTTIADSRAILRDLSPRLIRLFEEKGVMYVRNLHGGDGATIGKSWQQTFETSSKSDVEKFCKDGQIKYEWKSDGSLRLSQARPAIASHPKTSEKVWFNQVDQFHPSTNPPDVYEAIKMIFEDTPFDMPQYGCFGDGSPIADELLEEIRAVAAKNTVAFPWERGDLMVIDNMLTAHGRSPFTGARKVLVAMSN